MSPRPKLTPEDLLELPAADLLLFTLHISTEHLFDMTLQNSGPVLEQFPQTAHFCIANIEQAKFPIQI
jgi:hypothetical protein